MRPPYAAALLALATVSVAGQKTAPPQSGGDLVELDVVAVDRSGQPVRYLRQEDFHIKEDGRPAEIKTFTEIATMGTTQPDDPRSVVLLLDDVGVPMAGTFPMRAIAQAMLSPAGRGDDVAVVRLSRPSDEAFGDDVTARDRIDGYRGGMVPFSNRDTPMTALGAITRISRQLEVIEHRRKAIICVGVPRVCDPAQPSSGSASLLWPAWKEALSAAARANVSVYAVDPTGLTQGSGGGGVGLVTQTGGELFANSNDFQQAADAIWRQAGRYYFLGYWPPGGTRELHEVSVTVARKDVRLRVRRFRGN